MTKRRRYRPLEGTWGDHGTGDDPPLDTGLDDFIARDTHGGERVNSYGPNEETMRLHYPTFHTSRPGDLAVDCWCRRHVVSVPQPEVMALLTRSCGEEGCKAP